PPHRPPRAVGQPLAHPLRSPSPATPPPGDPPVGGAVPRPLAGPQTNGPVHGGRAPAETAAADGARARRPPRCGSPDGFAAPRRVPLVVGPAAKPGRGRRAT